MIVRVTRCGKVKDGRSGAEAKASPNRAIESYRVDPKRGDLHMSRVKRG